MTPIDSLVDRYLSAVAQAVADLPQQRREELLTDLREHITLARAELDPETEAGVRTILDQLGDPMSIASEARRDEPPRAAPPPLAENARAVPRRSRTSLWVVLALVLVVLLAVCVVGAFYLLTANPTSSVGAPTGEWRSSQLIY